MDLLALAFAAVSAIAVLPTLVRETRNCIRVFRRWRRHLDVDHQMIRKPGPTAGLFATSLIGHPLDTAAAKTVKLLKSLALPRGDGGALKKAR
jgi:hypothetical protein